MGNFIQCPKCNHVFDPLTVPADRAVIEIIHLQPEFGIHHKLVFEYAELFATTKPFKPLKLLRILTEIYEFWKKGKFAFQKKDYVISREGMISALQIVCNKSFAAPLENQNYLKKVMMTIAEQEASKRAATQEAELKRKEELLRTRVSDGAPEGKPAAIGELLKKMPWMEGK